MTGIERWVHIEAAPVEVAAELARSPWRSAMRIEPAGSGCRVEITARIEPEDLARSVEALVLDEVCSLKTRLSDRPGGALPGRQPNQSNTTHTNRRKRNTTMTTITRSITIDATAEEVWPALADFGAVSVWNPSVKESRLTSSTSDGEGMTRECQLLPVGTVQERVTEWIEGRMMSIEIFEFKNIPAMRSSTAVLSLEPLGPQTRVRMDLSYEVGLGALGAGMNSMMMKRQFVKAITGLLAGLKYHVETGDPVDRRSDLPTAAVAAG